MFCTLLYLYIEDLEIHLVHLRFIRRGRAARRKTDLDAGETSDFEEIGSGSDLENEEELREWLSTVNLKTKGLIPGEILVRKYMPPGTVMDLYEHYKATQSLLGGHCISYVGYTSVLFSCFEDQKNTLKQFRI